MSSFVRVSLLLAALCIAGPATAQDDPLTAVRPDGSGTLVLERTGDGAARLTTADGTVHTLGLPADSNAASLVAVHDGWVVAGSFVAVDGSRRLFVRYGDREIEAPDRGSRAPIRRSPVLLADGGELVGLAWLEGAGPQSLHVRAAAWNGRGFEAPERVSAVGPGTQTALRGAVLADGSWMLVWTAFDGEDDEVVWAQRVGDAWLPVRELGTPNGVPDIVPAVTASGLGALAAWSRYDGDGYRLVGARFDGTTWTELPWTGPEGSLYPTFHPGPDGPRLLYATARPSGWAVMDLAADGRERRRAAVATGSVPRPVLTPAPSTRRPERPLRGTP